MDELASVIPLISSHYQVQGFIHTGRYASILNAFDSILGQPIALKVFLFSGNEAQSIRDLFQSENDTMQLLRHQNILRMYAAYDHAKFGIIAYEFISGCDLKKIIHKGNRTQEDIPGWIMQICAGLEYAHAKNILHCDLKPQNIFVEECGNVLLSDFGLQKMLELTKDPNIIWGSPNYMAPELLRGGIPNIKTDIYALGVVIYELLTGRLPYTGETIDALMKNQNRHAVLTPSAISTAIAPPLSALVMACLEKKPSDRIENISKISRILSTIHINKHDNK